MKLDLEAKAAYMTMSEFKGLLEYSHSLPTGTTTGKVWKRHMNWDKPKDPKVWWLGQYGEVQGTSILIHWYNIYIEPTKVPA